MDYWALSSNWSCCHEIGELRKPITRRCLTPVPREPKPSAYHSVFAVPRCIFINIWNLTNIKNKVRAVVVLQADTCQNDMTACVVMETHLQPAQPDAMVNIANSSIFRRDRNWSGRDMRNNGGVAIYIPNNLTVVNVYCRLNVVWSHLHKLASPIGTPLLVCGMCYPPRHNYAEEDLMSSRTNIVDNE